MYFVRSFEIPKLRIVPGFVITSDELICNENLGKYYKTPFIHEGALRIITLELLY